MHKHVLTIGLAALTVTALFAATGNRKVTDNPKSPSADTSIVLGGKNVTIEYNAPSARGRKVEGGLVPYDKVWRAGADSATTLTTDADLMIGDLSVPKGVYTLYVAGGEGGWKLIVNKQTGQWGTIYKSDQDLGRTALTNKPASAPVETLKITLTKEGNGATLAFDWGNTHATVPVRLGS